MSESADCQTISWINGKPADSVSSDLLLSKDRGLQYGDGLFETILVIEKKMVLQQQHLSRLEKDSKRLKINLDTAQLKKELEHFLKAISFSSGVIKILVTRSSFDRGYFVHKTANSNRILIFFPRISYPSSRLDGINISLSKSKLAHNQSLAGIKHLNRLEQVMAAFSWKKEVYQECIIQDQSQYVIEGLFSNLFMVKNGELFTPLLNRCGVQGVMRNYLLEKVCPSLDMRVTEKNILLEEVMHADEIFLCNSVYGVWPVNSIEVKFFGKGAVTKKILHAIDDLGLQRIYS